MGQETQNPGLPQSEVQEHTKRMAELYANIAMTDVFLHGAAVTSFGILQYPIVDTDYMSKENAQLYTQGRIITVRPDEIMAEVTDSSHPPTIFVIPPRSVERLAIREHSRGKRELQPSIFLYQGIDEKNIPIIDSVDGEFQLMEGLKIAALENMRSHNVDTAALSKPLKTIVKEALVNIAFTIGAGNINDAVARTTKDMRTEEEVAVSTVESILKNGGQK